MEKNELEKGLRIIEEMVGVDKDEYLQNLNRIHDGLGDVIVEQVFGKIYARKGLDLKTRQLITVALLLENGDKEQLLFHTKCALNLGVTKEEVIEMILQSITVIGMPKALLALKTIKEAFEF